MTVLVFGKTGQVAQELAKRAPDARFLSRAEADLTDPTACAKAIIEAAPTLVINAAAYTGVDKAEEDEATANAVNGTSPLEMAKACAGLEIPFVHISTDYVFDGSGDNAFDPDAPVAPLGVYGRSKLLGERGVVQAGGAFAILRTSWVFSAHGTNFVKTMLRLSESRDRLTIVADQVGGPTSATDIANACLEIGGQLARDPSKSGVYHFSGAPDVNWADFAREIFLQTGRSVEVVDIPSTEYPTPARRPLNSRMDNSRTAKVFGIPRPNWRSALTAALQELEKG